MKTLSTKIVLPKFLIPFVMLYTTIMFSCVAMLHKTVLIWGYSTSATVLIVPFWFIISDVVAEIYGFSIAKQILWLGILFQWVFSLICTFVISIHSPITWLHQSDYNYVFGGLIRFNISVLLSLLIAGYINIRLITIWKFLLRSRHFWLRSIGASGIGELLYTFIVIFGVFFGSMRFKQLLFFTLFSFVCKITYTILLACPMNLLTYIIKKVENLEDVDCFVNPFKK